MEYADWLRDHRDWFLAGLVLNLYRNGMSYQEALEHIRIFKRAK